MPLPPMPAPPRHNQLPPDRQADPALGADLGEYLSVSGDPDEIRITEAPDGGAYVDQPGERVDSTPPDEGFYANLAAVLPDHIKARIVSDLLRKVEEDREARKERDSQYEEGIRRTGLGNDAPGGAGFKGASRTVHPMMTEACIDFASRIMKEIFPPAGPVRPKILGVVTKDKTATAQRKTDHMNWQVTDQIKEARSVLEVTLTQTPLGGSQFIRQYYDHRLKRPRWQFIPIDKVMIPAGAADFASATRKTFVDKIDAVEFYQRIQGGMYLDLGLPAPSQTVEPTKAESASRKVEGVSEPSSNLDGDRTIYEVQAYLEVSDEAAEALRGTEQPGELNPYLISIDEASHTMLSMYRDWEDGDEAREPIEHLFEFPFLPWRGAYSIGFPQVIGGLSAAATGALRALLDSAHIANAAGGYLLKGSGAGGQTRSPEPGELVEIDAGLEADDIRKRVLPNALNQPSPVLFQLLGFVTEAAKGVVRTSLDEQPVQGGAPTPVGTQMSRVEEGMVVFSSLHARAHAAMDRLLAGLHRLNRLYMPESIKVDATGQEIMVRRRDYEGPCDIQPVSEPTIYSDQQRFAQLNYIQARMMAAPPLWNARAVELAGLRLIKWPDPETLLNAAPEPRETNAVTENVLMATGKPVAVFPEQDHLAHLQVLLDFGKSPALGANPLIAPRFLPAASQHAAEHIVNFYARHMLNVVEGAAGQSAESLLSEDVDVKAALDKLLAQASQTVVPDVEQALSGALPILEKAAAALQQMAPKPPMDPGMAAVQAAAAETARKSAADQAGHQLDQAELANKTALQQQANQIAASRVRATLDGQQLAAQTKLQVTQMDAETAEQVAQEKAMEGAQTQYTNGESLGETQ